MKRITNLFVLFFILSSLDNSFAQVASKSQQTTYTNPLPLAFGDPYVLYVKGDRYYMYGTGGGGG